MIWRGIPQQNFRNWLFLLYIMFHECRSLSIWAFAGYKTFGMTDLTFLSLIFWLLQWLFLWHFAGGVNSNDRKGAKPAQLRRWYCCIFICTYVYWIWLIGPLNSLGWDVVDNNNTKSMFDERRTKLDLKQGPLVASQRPQKEATRRRRNRRKTIISQ